MNYFKSGLLKKLFKYILLIIMAPTLLFVIFFSNYVTTMRERGTREMLQSGKESFSVLKEDFALMRTEIKIREGNLNDILQGNLKQNKPDSDRFFYVFNSEGDSLYAEGPEYFQQILQNNYLKNETKGKECNSVHFIERRMILTYVHPIDISEINSKKLYYMSGIVHSMKVWDLLSDNFPIDFTFLQKNEYNLEVLFSTAITPFGEKMSNRHITPVPELSVMGQKSLSKKENTITGTRAVLFELRDEMESNILILVSLSENYQSEEISRFRISIISMISFIILIILFSLIALNSHIIEPLYILTKSAESFISKIKRGETPSPALVNNDDEIGELASYFNYIGEELSSYTETLTERVRSKTEALTLSNKSLEKALREAHKADKAKTVFLSNMSHEMRTPLHAIIGYTELLQTEKDPETSDKYTRIILNESDKLQALIGEVLDLARIESGRISLKMQSASLKKLTEDLRQNMHVSCLAKNLECSIILDEDIHALVITDPLRLYQVLGNLTGNAIKFTDKGRITVHIRKLKEQSENSQTLEFAVEDTGIGIPEHMSQQIFDSFVQVDFSRDRKYGGAGLGLSIAKEIINLMGGKLIAENRKEGGSRFSFTLTFLKSEHIDDAPEKAIHEDFSYLNILIAEDYEPNRGILSEQLNQLEIRSVDTAVNGLDAVKKCSHKKYDIIFMDINMPVMDGLTAAKKIQKTCPTPPAIIGLTANANPEDLAKYIHEGLDYVLTKPLRKKEIIAFLSSFIAGNLVQQNFAVMTGKKEVSEDIIWNYKALLDDLNHNHVILKQLMNGFFKEWDKESDTLRQYVSEKNRDGTYRIIHSVKGAALNLRAEKLSRISEELCKSIISEFPADFSTYGFEHEIRALKSFYSETEMLFKN